MSNHKHISDTIQYYGRRKQDQWVIEDVYSFKRMGYFVDVGAYDGIGSSNTYALEKYFDWSGICIEANPSLAIKLKDNRNCHTEEAFLWSEKGKKMEFVRWGIRAGEKNKLIEAAVNSLDGEELKKYLHVVNTRNIIILESDTLENILDKYKSPKYIDFLSMDIEGSEHEALKNFPFDKYVFGAVVIERNNHKEKTENIRNLFSVNGYHLVKSGKSDDYYINYKNITKKR